MRIETLVAPLEHDCARINALLTQLSEHSPILSFESLQRKILSQEITMVVARDETTEIVGMACLSFFENFPHRVAYVSAVVVDTRFRGKGIATKLMLQLHDRAEKHGVNHIWLTSNPNNPDRAEARKLYRKLGYKERGGLFCLALR